MVGPLDEGLSAPGITAQGTGAGGQGLGRRQEPLSGFGTQILLRKVTGLALSEPANWAEWVGSHGVSLTQKVLSAWRGSKIPSSLREVRFPILHCVFCNESPGASSCLSPAGGEIPRD